MAAGDPKFIGITSGTAPVLQEGREFPNNTYGLDEGRATYLCHPDLATSFWPQLGDAHPTYSQMFVSRVSNKLLESTLIELSVDYSGKSAQNKPDKLTPSTDTSVFSYEAKGINVDYTTTVNVQVPVPTLTREYVKFTAPDQSGVGLAAEASLLVANGGFLYTPGTFTFTISSSVGGLSINYLTGWVLASRTSEAIVPAHVWMVTENYHYFYALA